MPGLKWLRICVVVLLAAGVLPGLFVGAASAQVSGVELDIKQEHLGLGGVVRRGSWTPVRLELYNQSAEPLDVVCRWVLLDDDKDRVVSERQATLGPQRDERVWLYGNPTLDSSPLDRWVFQVVAEQTGELLTQQEVSVPPSSWIEPQVNLVGVCGFASMGLRPYDRWATQHERQRRVEGLNLETLPDRWYGLSSLSALVWGPEEGGDPDSIKVTEPMRGALREWVYRGGHLVIVMPAAGQTWTSSGLKDLIEPLTARDFEQIDAVPPADVFGVLRDQSAAPMLSFEIAEGSGYTTLAGARRVSPSGESDDEPLPIIVGHRFGFGKVTLVGIDLTSAAVLRSFSSDFDIHRVWTRVFGWRAGTSGTLVPPSVLDSEDGKKIFRNPDSFNVVHADLGDWLGQRVARQTSASGTLGLALVLFFLYGAVTLLTFPAVLRAKGMDRHSWLIFVVIIGVFSGVAWGGAALLRPAKTSATHFSVLTIDGNRNLVHTQSWVSLFVPSFDAIEVAVPSDPDGVLSQDLHHTLSSPGLSLNSEDPGYPDTQTYTFDAAQPDRVTFPIRATTKPFVADFLGQITGKRDGLSKPWTLPVASVSMGAGDLPVGTVTHRFDQQLTDVLIIYCPGGAGLINDESWKPIVWEYRNASDQKIWSPNEPLTLPTRADTGQRLWLTPRTGGREFKNEGFLGNAINGRGSRESGSSDADVVKDLTLLTFFDAMPPPRYQREGQTGLGYGNEAQFWTYARPLLREVDLTDLTSGRRLIILGHLRSGPIPMPLTVDGEDVPTDGWTVVRWVYDLD